MSLSERAKAFSMEALLADNSNKTSDNDNENLSPVFGTFPLCCGESSLGSQKVHSALSVSHLPLGAPWDPYAQLPLQKISAESPERDGLQGNGCSWTAEADRSSLQRGGHRDDAGVQAAVDDLPISKTNSGITVSLEKAALWRQFQKCGTEMILNRAGRRMFPPVVVSISGLDARSTYRVYMDVVPADCYRHKFTKAAWVATGPAEITISNPPYEHPDSAAIGSTWMESAVSFAKAKITNSKDSVEGNFLLHSMHKYQIRIVVVRLGPSSEAQSHLAIGDHTYTFLFEETAFVAVTAYQNHKITRLKIKNNPFAKAFRDSDVMAILEGARLLTGSDVGAYQAVYGDKGYPSSGPIVLDSNQIPASSPIRAKQRHPQGMKEKTSILRPTPIWLLPGCGFPYPAGSSGPAGNAVTLQPNPSPALAHTRSPGQQSELPCAGQEASESHNKELH